MQRPRRGFTLAELIVVLILIAALAAITVPTVKARATDAYENSLLQELDNLESAILAYRQNVGHYPPTLDYLVALPTPTSSQTDACGNSLVSNSGYRGPYVSTPITVTTFTNGSHGFVFGGRDTILDSIGPRKSGVLQTSGGDFYAIYVRTSDATTEADLDLKVDGVANSAAGTIRYPSLGTPGANSDSLIFVIPVKSGAC